MAGNRLFAPNEGLDIRGPLDNNRINKNVVNPPRFSQNGGLDGPSKTSMYRNNAGIYRNNMTIAKPGGSISGVPMGPGANPMRGR